MDECPLPGDLGPERTLTCQWGVCSARPFANYGCLAKHLKRVHKISAFSIAGHVGVRMEREGAQGDDAHRRRDQPGQFRVRPVLEGIDECHMRQAYDVLPFRHTGRGRAASPSAGGSDAAAWALVPVADASAAIGSGRAGEEAATLGGSPPKRHRVCDAPAAAARGRPSAFSLAEKQFIALQCSKFFDHVRTDSAPPLNYVRDDIALAGLAGREFTVAVDPSNADEFKKFVESVRHVARSWVDYLPAADAD